MTEAAGEVRRLVEAVQQERNVPDALSELKILLLTMNSSQLKDISPALPLELFFDSLNSSNERQIRSAYNIIETVLPTLVPSVVLANHSASILRCLGHPVKEVKGLALNEIMRAVQDDNLAILISENQDFVLAIVTCLCDEEVIVGITAGRLLAKLCHPNGVPVICDAPIVTEFKRLSAGNDTYRIRMYEVVVEICISSPEKMRQIENKSVLFSGLVDSLRCDDVLANLATIEVITPLALCKHGFEFLSRNDVIKFLTEILISAESNPLSSLFFPGLAKFFGYIGQKHPEQLSSDVLHSLFIAVDSSDLPVFVAGLEALGLIAYSPQGKTLLKNEDEQHMIHVMQRLHLATIEFQNDWKVKSWNALANLIHVETDFLASGLADVTEKWFSALGPNGMSHLVETAMQPFIETKQAALSVLNELCVQRWGQIKMMNNTNLMDYLLNVESEDAVECRWRKHDIVKCLAESEFAPTVFPQEIMKSLKQLATHPHGVPSTTVLVDMMSQ